MSDQNESGNQQEVPKFTTIKPTVGRIVHFYENYQHGDNDPLAAIVVHVTSTRCVNLSVFDKWGGNGGRTDIQLIQPGDDIPAPGSGIKSPGQKLGFFYANFEEIHHEVFKRPRTEQQGRRHEVPSGIEPRQQPDEIERL